MLTEYDILARDYQQAQVRCITFTENVLCSFGMDQYSLFLRIWCKMQQGVSSVNFLSLVVVGDLVRVFPLLFPSKHRLEISGFFFFFLGGGGGRLFKK